MPHSPRAAVRDHTRAHVDVRPAAADTWDELADFFGPSGAYGNCWCAWFRRTGSEFDSGCRDRGAGNRDFLQDLTLRGATPGLIAYDDDRPVGWVSVAPRVEFGRVLRSPTLRPRAGVASGDDPADPGVYAIVCFWIPRADRGRGVATALLDAAVEYARSCRATRIEAYPVHVAPGARADAAGLFTGTVGMFERAGFVSAGRGSDKRPVMSLDVRARG
jgi:GNAT superfamily N-acetyltransferase